MPFYAASLLNGLYLSALVEYQALFWAQDLFIWCVLAPALVLRIHRESKQDAANVLGVRRSPIDIGSGRVIWQSICCAILLPFVFLFMRSIPLGFLVPFPEINVHFQTSSAIPSGEFGLMVSIYFAVTAGILEELFYRAIPYAIFVDGKKSNSSVFGYVILSSAAFALVHWEQGRNAMATTFLFGLILALTYAKIRRIEPLIVGHAVTNVLIFSSYV